MESWTAGERALFRRLSSPFKLQLYLNGLKYDPEPETRSPRWIIREGKANCFEGALLAAAVLAGYGHLPSLVDLRAVNDDDHVIAVFRSDGNWGAVAKSNYTMIRSREPVYRSLRELVMSYFDLYFNPLGEKTLREYSRPMSLKRFTRDEWMTTGADLSPIGDALDGMKHFRILTARQVRRLEPVDRDVLRAGLLGANKKGLFRAKKS